MTAATRGDRVAAAPWRVGRPSGPDFLLLAVGVLGVSLSAPLTALCAAPALGIAFWRNAAGTAVLLPGGLRELRRRPMTRRELRLSLLAGAFLAAHFACWLPSISLSTVAASTALVCTTPIWTTLAARAGGTRVPGRVWAGLCVGLAGVVLVTGVDVTVSGRAVLGDGLALAGGVLAAGYVLVGAVVRETVSTSAYAVVCYPCAAVLLALGAVAAGVPLGGYAGRDWALIAAITVAAQLLGHTVFNRVVASVGPTVVGLAILLEVPGAALLALVLIGQSPPLLLLPGLALILGGLVLVVRSGPAALEPVPA